MNRNKNRKSAVSSAFLTMVLCIVMFVGSTFAWFTDNAQTGSSTVEAGILKVDLLDNMDMSLEGRALAFQNAGTNQLWEPGSVWTLQDVYIKNNGSLALKYKIIITGIKGDAELNNVIDWNILLGDEVIELTNGVSQEFHLSAGQKSEKLSIIGIMHEDAGNAYQGKKIEGISIKVLATQDTVESDAYDVIHDANATYSEGM